MESIGITTFYAGLLGLVLLWLSFRVIAMVRAKDVSLGDADNPEYTVIVRGQGNFVEYVPMILILMALDELSGVSAMWIHGMGAALVVARIMHPLGLTTTPGVNPLRFGGTIITFLVLLTASALAILNFF